MWYADDVLGSRKWGAGPPAVLLTIQGPWVVGLVANQVWSLTGSHDGSTPSASPNVSRFLTQYFVNYDLPNGWYGTSSPIITADWEVGSGDKWTVAVGGGFGKVFCVGKLPFNGNISAYANVVRPDPGPDWTLRLQIALLLPKSIF